MRLVLIHGAATDSRAWHQTIDALHAHWDRDEPLEILAVDRPQTGDWDTECAALAPVCADAYVVGVSGGATLGLELAARGVPMRAALLHEPAAGSLAPGLLAHVAEGLQREGVAGFGRALYGPLWNPSATEATHETVRAEFAMFGAFEPRPLTIATHRVHLSVGELSPPSRHDSVHRLAGFLGVDTCVIPGARHAVHLQNCYWPHILDLLQTRAAAATNA
ncbi:alpha/beta fold hydrolase [Dietzia kunjamensis]|uniref:alpha/beta fold hydrolase n=1 Tax=Dietzia kunjamensis TaxID=322509 RepID=UPI002097298D|nr:alpha/beta fold hydrolase [Dietzia kunjamensis]USX46015.1 alpha/beta fold hydrolase [Dietzia kunjamensis]